MRWISSLILILGFSVQSVAAIGNGGNYPSCSSVCQRREIHDLSAAEISKFLNAVVTLASQTDASGYSEYDRLVANYRSASSSSSPSRFYTSTLFLPFIRKHLYEFEKKLRLIDPEVCIPYWAWTYETDMSTSTVWGPDGFGGINTGTACINSGVFTTLRVSNTAGSDKYCPARKGAAPYTTAFATPTDFRSLILNTDKSYAEFTTQLLAYSSSFISKISGADGTLAGSNAPVDPLYLIHYAFIDKLWADRQAVLNAKMITTPSSIFSDQGATILSTVIPAFSDTTVGKMVDISNTCSLYVSPNIIVVNAVNILSPNDLIPTPALASSTSAHTVTSTMSTTRTVTVTATSFTCTPTPTPCKGYNCPRPSPTPTPCKGYNCPVPAPRCDGYDCEDYPKTFKDLYDHQPFSDEYSSKQKNEEDCDEPTAGDSDEFWVWAMNTLGLNPNKQTESAYDQNNPAYDDSDADYDSTTKEYAPSSPKYMDATNGTNVGGDAESTKPSSSMHVEVTLMSLAASTLFVMIVSLI